MASVRPTPYRWADGRLGFDDRIDLESRSGLLSFEGRFVGNRWVGIVAIAGVAPVADVAFTRLR